METEKSIKKAYQGAANKYDDILTLNKWWAKLGVRMIWGFKDMGYVSKVLSFIPDKFEGKLLDVPVGTAVFTCEKYKKMKNADITCLDYSEDMMERAKQRFKNNNIQNISCTNGDVGNMQFKDGTFDIVLSMNGFHVFPNKENAFMEIVRVLKIGGTFCGCFYIKDENRVTDWFINHIYVPKGYFTAPFQTKGQLQNKLKELYTTVEIYNVQSIVYFKCKK